MRHVFQHAISVASQQQPRQCTALTKLEAATSNPALQRPPTCAARCAASASCCRAASASNASTLSSRFSPPRSTCRAKRAKEPNVAVLRGMLQSGGLLLVSQVSEVVGHQVAVLPNCLANRIAATLQSNF